MLIFFLFLCFCLETGQKCGRPPVIANGDITTFSKKQYASGSSVEYKCQHFYTLQGKNTIFCINGDWTKPPFCMGKNSFYKINFFDISISKYI